VRILLDTHAFLWLIGGDASLSPRARRAIETPDSEPMLSAASLWEMADQSFDRYGVGRIW
jgi:PIN domain nuclease of toxin-antitoxin system